MGDRDVVTSGAGRGTRSRGGPLSATAEKNIVRAWERFAAGAEDVEGVRPEIINSWQRCRDQYEVDPHLRLAPGAAESDEPPPVDDDVLVELGALASELAHRIEPADGIVTVTNGGGKVLHAVGSNTARSRALDSNLAPWAAWSERASGTNGMGTALQTSGPVSVVGAEHWCAGFQQWACAGVAPRDVVTDTPVASVNVSRWRAPLPPEVLGWLARVSTVVENGLRKRAIQDGQELVEAFAKERVGPGAAAACLDVGGRVLIANGAASDLLGTPADMPMLDPVNRRAPELTELTSAVRWAVRRAHRDPQWVGSAQLAPPVGDEPIDATLRPVFVTNRLRGVLCQFGALDGESYNGTSNDAPAAGPTRIAATRGHRVVLVAPSEIRYCEAERNTIWLDTDRGRLQASARGLDKLEPLLRGHGFQRVHRRYLINLRRVLEAERGAKGELFLVTDLRNSTLIPVARRHVGEVKTALGL